VDHWHCPDRGRTALSRGVQGRPGTVRNRPPPQCYPAATLGRAAALPGRYRCATNALPSAGSFAAEVIDWRAPVRHRRASWRRSVGAMCRVGAVERPWNRGERYLSATEPLLWPSGKVRESLLTNQPLCQLSYAGLLTRGAAVAPRHITDSPGSTGGPRPGCQLIAHSGGQTC
jgi:hypothetical protein